MSETNLTHLADLRAAEYNPRQISPEALTGLGYSMSEFGDISGIVWNSRTGRLVAGHQRVRSLRERFGDLAIEDGAIRTPDGHVFQVRIVDWPLSREQAANIAANSPSISGEFTEDLGPLLRELQDSEPQLFTELRLEDLFAALDSSPPKGSLDEGEPVDAGDGEELRAKWGVEPGQLWLIPSKTVRGQAHRLLCGDCTKSEDVKRLMDGRRAVLFATDPPYLVGYTGADHLSSGGVKAAKDWGEVYKDYADWDDPSQGVALYEGYIRCAVEHAIEPSAAWYHWHAGRRQAMLEAVWEKYGAFVSQTVLWVKNRGTLVRMQFMMAHEPCFFGWLKGHRPEKVTDEWETTTWHLDIPCGEERPDHPTPKPLECFGIPMRQNVKPGGLCYEPFSGSGTQFVVGEQLGRLVFGLEIAPPYVAVALERLSRLGLEPRRE